MTSANDVLGSAFGTGSAVPVLQPGTGPILGDTYLASSPGTVLWGRLPAATDSPVLSVAPGSTVTIDTVSHEGLLPDQGGDPVGYFGEHGVGPDQVLTDAAAIAATVARGVDDGPHVVTGPIEVVGAQPGDVLAVHLLEHLRRVPYGVISNRHGRGALPAELPRDGHNVSVFTPVEGHDDRAHGVLPLTPDAADPRRVRFPLAEFLGVLGVATPGPRRPHSVPPGRHGGNIDITMTTAGSTVYLPVAVPGALFYAGDPHFAQGNGEVALTALEASLRSTVQLDLIPRDRALAELGELSGPVVRTAEHLVPTGMDADLDVAVQKCVRAALDLLQARWGMAEHLAYAYLSAATDFDISQVVDQVKGVHARIRLADFEELAP
ncbi:acetamidase/formamidase family protein [Isoptericola sp. S6320L]|uniref:acetamidase/formamidase family protein n=1 Tax=Isoptericola sp. S6320L TaxID=2926411 RepID=UPI001FF3DF89|nr:acetamidase/formamidase family protein [Isoptericola sp. S6320L]MCK0115967.1 acetamidase/formamidase family protein [Isoptericola sp. S6320L]